MRASINIGLTQPLMGLKNMSNAIPLQIPNCALWLDANDAASITLNGSNISQWNDKSGNANHATQSTAASQPAYNSVQIDGKPTATFDNSNDLMNLTTPIAALNSVGFVVGNFAGGGGVGPFAGDGTGSGDLYFGNYAGTLYFFDAAIATCNGASARDATARVYSYISQNDNNSLFADSTTIASAQSGAATHSFSKLGNRASNEWLNGNIGEVLIYSRVLSGAEITQINTYLKAKWGTA